MTRRNRNKIRALNRAIALLPAVFVLAALLLAGTFAGLSAKYVHQEKQENKFAAHTFYFTSDLLTEAGADYNLDAGTTDLTIELRNYQDELRAADAEISYEYTVTRTDGSFASGSGTIDSDRHTAKIELSGLTPGKYTVTAKATAPFTKTLKGTFAIPEEDVNLFYKVTDSADTPYALLTVYTKDYEGDATIAWPSGLIPDNAQEAQESLKTGSSASSMSITVEKFSSYTYRFFKSDTSAKYDESSITATKAN